MNELLRKVSIPEEGLSEIEVTEKEGERFSETYDWFFSWCHSIAEIKIDVKQNENDDWNGLDLSL